MAAKLPAKPVNPVEPVDTFAIMTELAKTDAEAARFASRFADAEGLAGEWNGEAFGSTRKDVKSEVAHSVRLHNTFGTASSDFMKVQLGAVDLATRGRGEERGKSAAHLNAATALIRAVNPSDELEAALAVQMAATHSLAMEMLGKARQTDDRSALTEYGALATKLSRSFTAQVEALAKLRGKGKQTVEVIHVHKHVYVAPGGQAIVGDVHHGRGGGAVVGRADQSYAPAQLSDETSVGLASMWSQDAVGIAMQRAGGEGQEALSDARRDQSGRATRTGER